MRRMLSLLVFLCFLLAGCNSNADEIPAHELYQYSGEVISLVNQHGKEIEPYKVKINFTLGLINFIPTENKKTLIDALDLTNGVKWNSGCALIQSHLHSWKPSRLI